VAINDADVVASKHFTAFEKVACSGGTFTYEGEYLGDQELLEVRCWESRVELCQPWEAFVVED